MAVAVEERWLIDAVVQESGEHQITAEGLVVAVEEWWLIVVAARENERH